MSIRDMKKQMSIVSALMAFIFSGCFTDVEPPESEALLEQTVKPAVKSAGIAKTAAEQDGVEFTLKSAFEDAEWRVYTANTDDTETDEVWAESDDTALFLLGGTDIPAGSYYVTATLSGKRESDRLKLTVYPYTAPVPEPPASPFVPVTGIIKVPPAGTVGVLFDLNPAAVSPGTAAKQDIEWSVISAVPPDPGVPVGPLPEKSFTPAVTGIITLQAKVTGGLGAGKDYTETFMRSVYFVPVMGITNGPPTSGNIGKEIDFRLAEVFPENATKRDIVWSIRDAGTTGVTAITGNRVTPAAAGTLTLIAAVPGGGATAGTDYTEVFSIEIAPFVPVTYITGVPETVYKLTTVDLSGVTVQPNDANQTIFWSIEDPGTTGVKFIDKTRFTTTSIGSLTLRAAIAGGQGSSDYINYFIITVDDFRPVLSLSFKDTLEWKQGIEVELYPRLTIIPNNATVEDLSWSVVTPGGGVISGFVDEFRKWTFTPAILGEIVLRATVVHGKSLTEDYTQDLTIEVK
jgi:endo-1,4-beta-xylanase